MQATVSKLDEKLPFQSPNGDPGYCPLMPKIDTSPYKVVIEHYSAFLTGTVKIGNIAARQIIKQDI
jgi:hypothetical protein